MEIWGELRLPSDPLTLNDKMFENVDDSDQCEDDFDTFSDQRFQVDTVDSYVCDAAKALESVLSEALGKYPIFVSDDLQRIAENDVNKKSNQKRGKSKYDKRKRANSTSSVDRSVYCVDENDLLEFWHEIEIDEEIFSIDEEDLDCVQNEDILDPTDSSVAGFYLEYTDFLQDTEEDSNPSSPVSTPIASPDSSPALHSDGENSDSPSASGSSSDEGNTSTHTTTDTLKSDSKKRTLENDNNDKQQRKTSKKSRRSTKNYPSKSKLSTDNTSTDEQLSVLCVVESSASVPVKKRTKPSSKKRGKAKKNFAEIFKSNEVLKLEAVREDVNVDIGDASDFTNYN